MASLPWLYAARVVEQSGVEVASGLPVSVWPAQSSYPRQGAAQSEYRGEAPARSAGADVAAMLRVPNRRLVVDAGPMAGTYVILAATLHPNGLIPHVGLQLRAQGAR